MAGQESGIILVVGGAGSEEDRIAGQILNLVYRNYRIPELALRVQAPLAQVGTSAEIRPDHQYKGVRSYRVLGKKLGHAVASNPRSRWRIPSSIW